MINFMILIEDVFFNVFYWLLILCFGGGFFVDGYVLSIIGVVMLQMIVVL